MNLESALIAALVSCCPRVHTPVAPFATERPHITWQHIGGQTLRYVEGTPANRRNAFIQISVWGRTSKEAFDLIRAVEDALCAWPDLQTTPQGEPIDAFDEGDSGSRGALQSFSIYGGR